MMKNYGDKIVNFFEEQVFSCLDKEKFFLLLIGVLIISIMAFSYRAISRYEKVKEENDL